jgi:hypothetical protein
MLLLHTIKFLKPIQVYYRLFYFIRSRYRKIIGFGYNYKEESNITPLKLDKSIDNAYSVYKNGNFSFLNLSKRFDKNIDWNYGEYGKLWTYNLTYFEYLQKKEDIELIYDFIENIENIKDGLEPFPISLRGISWIKFLTYHSIEDKKIDESLYAQYYILMDNLEYHLLGNHLLENGFSLLFGAYYFEDEVLYAKASHILKKELNEQILNDGGHFELSPMYHQIMLFRVLDCINLIKNNNYKNRELLNFMSIKAELLTGWLQNISYQNGDIPLLNDSANKITPPTNELLEYAYRLNSKFKIQNSKLQESGYRKIVKDKYECIVDIGSVGAEYIPGHAHADSFNFELRLEGRPFIVDSGLSTYETNERRFYERSTKAHNTVEVKGEDSSKVWGGFRVANRAEVVELREIENVIEATHNGYEKRFSVLHGRKWEFEDRKVTVTDTLNIEIEATARIHFHPRVTREMIENHISVDINFRYTTYKYSPQFNMSIEAIAIELPFTKNIRMEILL